MKRMSEIFDLPVHIDGTIGIRSHGLNSTFEQDDHAAHAINHVDALADALAAFVDFKSDGVKSVGDDDELWANAESALKAYRGEKHK